MTLEINYINSYLCDAARFPIQELMLTSEISVTRRGFFKDNMI